MEGFKAFFFFFFKGGREVFSFFCVCFFLRVSKCFFLEGFKAFFFFLGGGREVFFFFFFFLKFSLVWLGLGLVGVAWDCFLFF